jgi:hypothetical protein
LGLGYSFPFDICYPTAGGVESIVEGEVGDEMVIDRTRHAKSAMIVIWIAEKHGIHGDLPKLKAHAISRMLAFVRATQHVLVLSYLKSKRSARKENIFHQNKKKRSSPFLLLRAQHARKELFEKR